MAVVKGRGGERKEGSGACVPAWLIRRSYILSDSLCAHQSYSWGRQGSAPLIKRGLGPCCTHWALLPMCTPKGSGLSRIQSKRIAAGLSSQDQTAPLALSRLLHPVPQPEPRGCCVSTQAVRRPGLSACSAALCQSRRLSVVKNSSGVICVAPAAAAKQHVSQWPVIQGLACRVVRLSP